MSNQLVQCHLRSGTTETIGWLEPKVKVGNLVTLKDAIDPNQLWTVVSISNPHDKKEIHRGWNNNI